MWYCCLAVISLCKRCGLLYKWGFSHYLYQVNAGERIHPCRLIRCDGGFLGTVSAGSAVLCCCVGSASTNPAVKQRSPGAMESSVLSSFSGCARGLLAALGLLLCVTYLWWKCCQPGTDTKLLSHQNSQRNSGISPPLQDRIILFRVATVQWFPEATHGYKCVASVSWYLFYGFFPPFRQMTKLQRCYGLAWIYESHSTGHVLKQRV